MIRTTKAAAQAMAHCHTTIPSAHLPPSSRFIEAMAATQGVYSRQKTSREAAVSGVSVASRLSVPPNSTDNVETTLSFAMKPAISAVEMRQFPKPKGVNTGAMKPAITASMLSFESLTILKLKSKVFNNR